MKALRFSLFILLLSLSGCEKGIDDDLNKSDERYVPTDVLVKIKAHYTIDKVFDFINNFDHEVNYIYSQVYTSDLPPDSLRYVLDYLNAKTYTNDGNSWLASGHLHFQTKVITIFPRLFNMKSTEYQQDWLESIKFLKLKEQTGGEAAGSIIYFHVPAGEEKEWEKEFKKYEFVEWTELNRILEIELH